MAPTERTVRDGDRLIPRVSANASRRLSFALHRLYAVAGLADQLSLLLDATGYRAMLRQSNAETYEDASRTRWS